MGNREAPSARAVFWSQQLDQMSGRFSTPCRRTRANRPNGMLSLARPLQCTAQHT